MAFKPKKEEIKMMKRMSLFSSVFRAKKNLSKEEKPSTSMVEATIALEEEMSKKGTLIGFLHEYESQTQRFRDHITFPEFCKIMVRRSKQHDEDRFILSVFDGSC